MPFNENYYYLSLKVRICYCSNIANSKFKRLLYLKQHTNIFHFHSLMLRRLPETNTFSSLRTCITYTYLLVCQKTNRFKWLAVANAQRISRRHKCVSNTCICSLLQSINQTAHISILKQYKSPRDNSHCAQTHQQHKIRQHLVIIFIIKINK